MNKNQIIAKALRDIARGLDTLATAYTTEEVASPVSAPEPDVAEDKPVVKKEDPVVEEDTSEEETIEEEELDLSELDLEDLQLIAKNMKLRGYKPLDHAELVEKLTSSDNDKLMTALEELGYLDSEEEVEEEASDEYEDMTVAELRAVLKNKGLRPQKTKEDMISAIRELDEKSNEPEPEYEGEEEEEEVTLSFDPEKLDEVELKGLCTILGISTRGKKQALLTRIYTVEESEVEDAYQELLETAVADTNEEEEEVSPKVSKKTVALKRETMTKERAKVLEELPEILEQEIKDDSISLEEISEILESLDRTEKDDTEEDLKEKYIGFMIDLTDDEGVTHDLEDPYFVNDSLRCCGVEVPVKKGDGVCPVCETHYEVE